MNFKTENTLAEIVRADYRAARVFEKYKLDFCCKGNRPLQEAASERSLDASRILNEISDTLNTPAQIETESQKSPETLPLDELAEHIVKTHHGYLRGIMPFIYSHSQKVKDVHGKNHPEVIKIADIYEQIQEELNSHMMKEEMMLFPFIVKLAEAKRQGVKIAQPPFGSVVNPISVMEREHTGAGDGLYSIRELSDNFTPPEDACSTYRVLFKEIEEFEADLHRHIHLENNILFPKSIELEKEAVI